MLRHKATLRPARALSSLLLCAAFALSAAVPASAQHHQKKTYKQEIEQLEEQWRQAQLTNDAATIDKLLSDDYIGISAQGMVSTKAQAVARIQARQTVLNKLDVHEQKISIHGETAVVTSQVEVDATNNSTQPPTHVHSKLRYTRVYLHYSTGAWKIVNFESTHISDMPGGGPLSAEPSPKASAPSTPPAQP
jgi:ketosteroid isomerase-like protein